MNSLARLVHDMVANNASGYPSSAAGLDEAERTAAMELESALLRVKADPARAVAGRAEDWLASPPTSREVGIVSAAAEDWLASPPVSREVGIVSAAAEDWLASPPVVDPA